MEEPLVSVIVPVYKVEPYLRKCLDSIIGQTYRNLEIILVDDGSPDNCGAICDEYAGKDERIVVIHKVNGGVSSARNAGLNAAKGEWIAWVDSDDWVEPAFIQYLLDNALEHEADIVVCGRYEDEKGKSVCFGPEEGLLSWDEAMEKLLADKEIRNYLWDKLWRATLFQGLRFAEGRTYEDIALCYQLFEQAKTILCLPEANYHYLIRSSGIVGDVSLSSKLSLYQAVRERRDILGQEYPRFQPLLDDGCLHSAVGIWCSFKRNDREEQDRCLPQIAEISAFSKEIRPSEQMRQSTGLAGRMVIRLLPYTTWWSFTLADWISRLYQLRHGRPL